MTTITPVLDIRDLTITYSTHRGTLRAASDVNFTINPGEVMGLVGESGSGKSTVAMAILDLLGEAGRIEKGSILFEGTDLATMTAEQRRLLRGDRIAAVFQDPFTSLNPALTIADQISEPLIHHQGMTKRQARTKSEELLAEVGIRDPKHVAGCYPHQLSGGMQQRVLIATALGCEPRLLILDEPTTALDVTVEARIIDLLAKLCDAHHLSALFVSHNLGIVNQLCDKVCVLYGSEVVETGPTESVLTRPAHPYTKGLLAALPRIGSDQRHRLPSIPGTVSKLSGTPTSCIFAPRCPFVEDACNQQRQALTVNSDGHQLRCWKSEQLIDQPWPTGEEHERKRDAAASQEKLGTAEGGRNAAPLVTVKDLRKVFGANDSIFPWARRAGNVAVRDATFSIKRGEVLGVVGESGSGKSTLGRTMLGLYKADGGEVLFDGVELGAAARGKGRDLRSRAQLVFQNSAASLNPRKTVGDAIERPLVLGGEKDKARRRDKVEKLLVRVGLPALYADRFPHELSGGERQRVNIARALASDPEFVVCDEAVSALDVSVQANILNLLGELRDEMGLAYLFITHDIAVVAHIADRALVIYGGGVCEEGPMANILRPPYHPYTEALLSAVPRLPGDGSEERQRILLDDAATAPNGKGCAFAGRCPRKLGTICDEQVPPVRQAATGHRIACHISLDVLARAEPIFPHLEPLPNPLPPQSPSPLASGQAA